MCSHHTVDAICANDCVRGCRRAVFEMNVYRTVLFVFEDVDAFIEVRAVRGDKFDELIEEVGPVHACLAGGAELSVDELAFAFAFAL